LNRDVPQRPIDAARTDGVTDRLVDAVARRHFEVHPHGGEATCRDGHHHEVRANESSALVGGGEDVHLRAELLCGELRKCLHGGERIWIYVLEHQTKWPDRLGSQ
jgi:hypothetical protein